MLFSDTPQNFRTGSRLRGGVSPAFFLPMWPNIDLGHQSPFAGCKRTGPHSLLYLLFLQVQKHITNCYKEAKVARCLCSAFETAKAASIRKKALMESVTKRLQQLCPQEQKVGRNFKLLACYLGSWGVLNVLCRGSNTLTDLGL